MKGVRFLYTNPPQTKMPTVGLDPLRTYTDCLYTVPGFFTPIGGSGRCEGLFPTQDSHCPLARRGPDATTKRTPGRIEIVPDPYPH